MLVRDQAKRGDGDGERPGRGRGVAADQADARLVLDLAQPGGEAFEPIGGDVRREREGQQVGVAARAFGGKVGEIDRQGLVADGGGRIVVQKVHAFDERVAGDHELMALGDHEHGGVVACRPSAPVSVASGAK